MSSNSLAAPVASETPAPHVGSRASPHIIRVGFMPLIDMAVLVAAEQQGFAGREGLQLDLDREVSWSNIRDRMAVGQFDVAHMLSPMPVASQLGLGSNPAPCFTPFALGRGGNAITLSLTLYREMQQVADLTGPENALGNARALKAVVERRKRAGEKPLVFGMTYPFSSHNYEFRYWLAAGDIDPMRDVIMTVVPPSFTVDALTSQAIDGFCVNAPWNVIAVARGVGRIVATKADIWPSSPEKVLGVNPEWSDNNPELLSRLMVALDAAARWCDNPDNHASLADMLAEPGCVGADPDLIRQVLSGEIPVDPAGATRRIDNYVTYHAEGANFPWLSQARWIYSQMVRWGQSSYDPADLAKVDAAYRPDMYRNVLGGSVASTPAVDSKIEGNCTPVTIATGDGVLTLDAQPFIDGRHFDPSLTHAYVLGSSIRAGAPS